MDVKNPEKRDKLFIVETMPGTDMVFDGNVVALTPEAMRALSSRGIPFTIPDDYFSMESYCACSKLSSKILRDWIESIDNKLSGKFETLNTLNIKPARLYGFYLQLLVDTFVAATLRIKAVIKALDPEEVVFCCIRHIEKPVDYQLIVKGCSIESVIIPFLCRKYKIPYVIRNIPQKDGFKRAITFIIRVLRVIKSGLKDLITLYSIYGPQCSKKTVLLLEKTWGIESIGRDARKEGYKVINTVPRYHFSEKLKRPTHYDRASLGVLIKAFDDNATEEVSALYAERLMYFFDIVCPNIECAIRYYLNIFKKQKTGLVITPYKSKFEDFAVMAAASTAKDTVAIQIDHGYSTFDVDWWKYTEQPCNIYVTETDELKQYHIDKVFRESKHTQIESADLWLNKYRDIAKRKNGHDGVKTVLYVPTLTLGNRGRNDGTRYFGTWYFMYQSKLLEYFSSERNFNFVCKYAPRDGEIRGPMSRIIRDAGWRNVIYTDGDLYENIKTADLAIVDTPSTPFLETAVAGIPTVSLYYGVSPIRDSAKKFFGKMLQPFLSAEEAIERIKVFLADDPKDYVRSFARGEDNIFKVIQEDARRILGLKSIGEKSDVR